MESAMQANTIGITNQPLKAGAISQAHQDLMKAHAHLQDELYSLAETINDILMPIIPPDSSTNDQTDPPTSTMTGLLRQEVQNVYRITDYVNQLKDRVEI